MSEKHAGGRPRFEPTQQQRDNVRLMIGLGMRAVDVAKTVINSRTGEAISESTLRNAFRREVEAGQIELTALIGNVVVNTALGCEPSMGPAIKSDQARLNAAMFYLRTRAGWKESHVVENVGKDGGLIQQQADVRLSIINDIDCKGGPDERNHQPGVLRLNICMN